MAKQWPKAICPNCKEEFQTSKDRRVYCVIDCARAHKTEMMNLARRKPFPPRDKLEGRMVADIRAEFDVCANTVYDWLESYGLHAPRPTLQIPAREVLEGKSQRSLEKELGVSRPTIRKWFKHYGITPLPSGRREGSKDKKSRKSRPKRPREVKVKKPLPRREVIYELRVNQSLSLEKTAKVLGISLDSLRGLIHTYDIPAPTFRVQVPPRDALIGKTKAVIEKEFGVCGNTVQKWRKHYNLPKVSAGRRVGSKDAKPRKSRAKANKPTPLPPVEKARVTKCVIPERPASRDKTQEDKERKMVEEWLRDHPRV